MVRKAVIPAAGFGTRFLPATKAQPKEMLPVVDTPVIHYVVEEAVRAGIRDIVMVIGRGKRAIEEYFDRHLELEQELAAKGREDLRAQLRGISDMADVHFIWQRELNGLGDAVYCARHHVGNEPFAVLLGDTILESATDVPVTGQLLEVFERYGNPVVALEEVAWDRVSRYGVMDGEPEPADERVLRIRDFIEKPAPDEAPSNLVIASRYVFTPDIFDCIARTGRGKHNEIQLTDAMRLLLDQRPMNGLRFAGCRHDAGNPLDFLKTNLAFALRRPDLRQPLADHLKALASRL